jgi:CheY-like chemotaxis protein
VPSNSPESPPSVLVVEDEALLLMLIAESLREGGFNVHEAGEAQSALSLLRAHNDIRLMLTDIRMPGMNGFQLTDAAVAIKPDLKVMLMTGYSEDALPQKLTAAGVRVLRKPFDTDSLPEMAKAILGHG